MYNNQISGWWVVKSDVTISDRQQVKGDVHLIITNGSKLTLKNGISVTPGNTLYIYGQSGNSGQIIANENKKEKCAGIGGGNNKSCGTIIINGGTVTSYGGSDAAGIGGGNEPDDGNVNGRITINGGIVKAYGGKYGAGIGGGDLSDGGVITINAGKVTGVGGQEAAAIGGGDGDGTKYGNGGSVTITGGNVTADSFEYKYDYNDSCLGAGIGGGCEGGAGTIKITGGKVEANGHRGGAGIGSGCDVNKKSNKSLIGGTITISGGEVHGDTPTPLDGNLDFGGGAGIGSGRNSPGCNITISGGTVYASGSRKKTNDNDGGAGIGNSQHSKGGSVTITGGTIHAYTSCDEASAIGKGQNGKAPTCTLDYPGCKVWRARFVSDAADRSTDAFKSVKALGDRAINIEPCDHPGLRYLNDETSHSAHCQFCGADMHGDHTWKIVNKGDQHSEVCTVCGYEGKSNNHEFDKSGDMCVCGAAGVRIHFEPNGGGGQMPDEIILKGKSYYLPECSFTPPQGLQFLGWKVSALDSGRVYHPGRDIYKPQKTVTVTAQWDDVWHSLQELIDSAENGDTIVLDKNYTAGSGDVEFLIAPEKDITIDLNGYTIDRALNANDKYGSVFRVQGGLTIIDSSNPDSGVIKGGKPLVTDRESNSVQGCGGAFTVEGGTLTLVGGIIQDCAGTAGAVWLGNSADFHLKGATIKQTDGLIATVVVSGGSTFNMSSGWIKENEGIAAKTEEADPDGAAVYVEDGSFHMSGGSILDNDISGVKIGENGSFAVSGSPVIKKNRCLGNSEPGIRNVYLAAGQAINITDELGSHAMIGVTVEDGPDAGKPRVFTSGLKGNGSDTAFASDNEQYSLAINSDKEAILGLGQDNAAEIPVESVEISPSQLTLEVGQQTALSAVLQPENATNDQFFWLSDNTKIVSVNQRTGKVTAISAGSATIVVFTADGHQAECSVTVTGETAEAPESETAEDAAAEDETPSTTGSVFSHGAGFAVGIAVVVLIGAAVGFVAVRKR